jgi:hypothetical protein
MPDARSGGGANRPSQNDNPAEAGLYTVQKQNKDQG